MSHSLVLDKYRDIVVANAEQRVHALALELRKLPLNEQRRHFGGSAAGGFLYLFRDEKIAPGMVMECVMSTAGDAITSLYTNNRVFENPGTVMQARAELIAEAARKIGMPPESIGIDDPARGRALGLEELSTGQLIDILAEREGMTVMRTDSHGVELQA